MISRREGYRGVRHPSVTYWVVLFLLRFLESLAMTQSPPEPLPRRFGVPEGRHPFDYDVLLELREELRWHTHPSHWEMSRGWRRDLRWVRDSDGARVLRRGQLLGLPVRVSHRAGAPQLVLC